MLDVAGPLAEAELVQPRPVSRDSAHEANASPQSPTGSFHHRGNNRVAAVAKRDPDCLFCPIAAGDRPAEVVFEDDRSLAFLDNRPLFPGHALLIPREHHETLADLPDDLLEPLFANARLLSRAIPEAMGKPGSFVALNNVVSQSVPHLHVHVVPRVRRTACAASSGRGPSTRPTAEMANGRRARSGEAVAAAE